MPSPTSGWVQLVGGVFTAVVGIGVLLTWEMIPGSQVLHEVFPAMALSTLAFYLVSLATADSANDLVLRLMSDRG